MEFKYKSFGYYEYIFAIYIGAGPIYWLPWIPLKFVEGAKLALYVFVVTWPLLHISRATRFYFPGGSKVFLWMIAFFAFSIPSMLLSEMQPALYKLQNTVQILLLLFACGFLEKRGTIEAVARLSVEVFALFCLFSVVLIFIIPNYTSPLNGDLVLAQTGFGGSRTGWSPAIALYLPWVYTGIFVSGLIVWLGCLVMLANQVLVAGRTGMISALVAFIIYGVTRKNIKGLMLTFGILSAVYFFAINNMELLRLNSGGVDSRAALDELSTGRIEVYITSFKIISEYFIAGIGIGDIIYAGEKWSIHNVILKSAAESGVLHAVTIVGIFFVALQRGLRGVFQKNLLIIPAFLTVLSGIVSSFFEPVGMFGTFYSAGFWWVCFSICVSYRRTYAVNFTKERRRLK